MYENNYDEWVGNKRSSIEQYPTERRNFHILQSIQTLGFLLFNAPAERRKKTNFSSLCVKMVNAALQLHHIAQN